jgi:tetratricopeptide (TPR) repeat protein
LDNSGNSTGAIEYFDRALAIDPNDQDILMTKGYALDSLGNSNDDETDDGGINGGGQNNNNDSSVGSEGGNDSGGEEEQISN